MENTMKRFAMRVMSCIIIVFEGAFGCDAGLLESRAEMFLRKIARGKTTEQTNLKKELNFVRDVRDYCDINVSEKCAVLESEILETPKIIGQSLDSSAFESFLSAANSINGSCSREINVALYLLLEKFLAKLSLFLLEKKETADIISAWQKK
jgi:hypothetical protein